MKGTRQRFYFREHLEKGRAYVETLQERGYYRKSLLRPNLHFAFFDHEISWARRGWRPDAFFCKEHDIPFFIYPHAANCVYLWDVNKPWPYTAALFTQGEGQKEILHRLNYPCPVEVSGWTYTEIRPFDPPRRDYSKLKVLFGPIHPMGNGWIPDVERELNRKVFEVLVKTPGIQLTVRHVRDLAANNIWEEPGVRYIRGATDNTTKEIEQADLVVGPYTFAYLAIALGKPTLMFGQSIRPHTGSNPTNLIWGNLDSWSKWKNYIAFPYSIDRRKRILDSPTRVRELMNEAIKNDVDEWRRLFIGEPYNPEQFVERVKHYVG